MTLPRPSCHPLALALWLAAASLTFSCRADSPPPPPPPPPATAPATSPASAASDTVQIPIKGQVFTLEIAETPEQQARGLMQRKSMPEDHGMIFIFSVADQWSFWMKDTLIPLDIIFLDAQGKVVAIHERQPLDETGRAPDSPALFVIELNAGRSKAIGLKPGDRIELPGKVLKRTPASSEKTR